MPVNFNALIRYKTIHKCLLDRQSRQQYMDLFSLQEAIYDQTGFKVSERTVRGDIQLLRDEFNELGIVLPIRMKRGFGYYYPVDYEVPEDIMMPLDKELLRDIGALLAQFTRFNFFEGYKTSLNILIDGSQDENPVIQLDYNPDSMGQALVPDLRRAIKDKKSLIIEYQSFQNSTIQKIPFLPSFIKIYNNRWYVVGYHDKKKDYDILPLDRIKSMAPAGTPVLPDAQKAEGFDAKAYFRDVVGVSVMHGRKVQDIVIRLKGKRAHYVHTKPLHSSQVILQRKPDSITFKLRLKINPELISLLLSFGSELEVIEPPKLRAELRKTALAMHKLYAGPEAG